MVYNDDTNLCRGGFFMQCFYHEEKDAVGQCAVCGKFVCKDCARQYDNTPLMCYDCAKTGYEEWKEDARRLKRNSIIGAAVGAGIAVAMVITAKTNIVSSFFPVCIMFALLILLGAVSPFGWYWLKEKRIVGIIPLRALLSPILGIIAFPIVDDKIHSVIYSYEADEDKRNPGYIPKNWKKCKNCNRKYDEEMKSCPHCGFNSSLYPEYNSSTQ